MNVWYKAYKFNNEAVTGKTSMVQRFKKNKHYWDYIEGKEWRRNKGWCINFHYLEKVLHQFLGKSFKTFRAKIMKSDFYRYDKGARYVFDSVFQTLGKYNSEVSYVLDYYVARDGIIYSTL